MTLVSEAVRAELRELVAARAELNSRERELIVLARASGFTWAELAEDVGLTAAGVRSRHLALDPIYAREIVETADDRGDPRRAVRPQTLKRMFRTSPSCTS